MPYKAPYAAPFRPLPAGQPQLGFDPVTIATAVASFANKIKSIGGLFKSSGPDWTGTAQRVITAYMNGQAGGVEGTAMNARQFIEYYAQNANTETGRNVYRAALQTINDWDAQQAAQNPTSIFGTSTGPTGTTQAGMSPLMMVLLAGAVVGGVVLMKRRK